MHKIKTVNKIADSGLNVLTSMNYCVSDDIEDPDALLVRSADLHGGEFHVNTVAISRAGAGTNNIPVEKCTLEGIVVFNTPGANAEAVKELAICSLLMASRDVLGGIEWVRSIAGSGDEIPKMVERGKASFAGSEIAGKTLGVIGLGAVGAKIANTALSLGMDVYGYDPYISVDAAWHLSGNVVHALDLETIYKNCDYITLHVPYIEATHHMLSTDAFAMMKNGVRIINLARGELVDDNALLAALDTAKVARYVTDFPNSAVAGIHNVVPMPHLGASTFESEEKCAIMAARQVATYLETGNIKNSVNFPTVELERMGVCRLCVLHMNVPRMITGFLDLIGGENINVAHMINKPRGEYAYTIIDTDSVINEEIVAAIAGMSEVLRVRIL